jgi:hypothetical protein
MTKRLSYEAPKLTRDEATELCVYHLRCAAGLYQLVPDDNDLAIYAEIERQNCDGLVEVDINPAKGWVDAIHAAYEEMKRND